MSPCMVPLLICIGRVVPKWLLENDMVELAYMLPTSFIAS